MPTLRRDPFNHADWLFEPKYDGFRGLLYLTRHRRTLFSKRGNAMTRFRDLVEQLHRDVPGQVCDPPVPFGKLLTKLSYDFNRPAVLPSWARAEGGLAPNLDSPDPDG